MLTLMIVAMKYNTHAHCQHDAESVLIRQESSQGWSDHTNDHEQRIRDAEHTCPVLLSRLLSDKGTEARSDQRACDRAEEHPTHHPLPGGCKDETHVSQVARHTSPGDTA